MGYYAIAKIGFILLTLLCVILVHLGLKMALKRAQYSNISAVLRKYWMIIGIWVGALTVLTITGFLGDFGAFPPRFPIVLLVPFVFIYFVSRSKLLKVVLEYIPQSWLLTVQFFRVPVEILIWCLFMGGATPIQMTFEGLNWDILSGILGPIAALLLVAWKKNRKAIIIGYNIIGLLLLINIVTVAILSLPMPFRYFMNEPANTEVTNFPAVFLPGILVPLAYTLHWFSLKKLLNRK